MIKQVKLYRGPNTIYEGRPDGLELVSDDGDTVYIDLNTQKAHYINRDGKTHVELLSPEDLFGPPWEAGQEQNLANPPTGEGDPVPLPEFPPEETNCKPTYPQED